MVGRYYFPPGPRLLSQLKRSPPIWLVRNYTAIETKAYSAGVLLAKNDYAMVPRQDSKFEPATCKSQVGCYADSVPRYTFYFDFSPYFINFCVVQFVVCLELIFELNRGYKFS